MGDTSHRGHHKIESNIDVAIEKLPKRISQFSGEKKTSRKAIKKEMRPQGGINKKPSYLTKNQATGEKNGISLLHQG